MGRGRVVRVSNRLGNHVRAQSPFAASLRAIHGGVTEVPVDLPPGDPAPASALGPNPEGGLMIQLPGAFAPSYGSDPIDEPGDADVAAGAEASLIQFRVPDGFRCRLNGIGFGADDETALTFFTWRIEVNATRRNPYVNQPAAIGSIRELAPIIFFAAGGQTVNIIGASDPTAGVPYRFVCRTTGWFFTEKIGRE